MQQDGVKYGINKIDSLTKTNYNYLQTENCTRKRLFHVEPAMSTFNAVDRSISNGVGAANPRGIYEDATRVPPPDQVVGAGMERNGWPRPVRGGHIMDHKEPADAAYRSHGGLRRNIVGDATIKDQQSTYYGPDSTYYGGNGKTKNHKVYSTKQQEPHQ